MEDFVESENLSRLSSVFGVTASALLLAHRFIAPPKTPLSAHTCARDFSRTSETIPPHPPSLKNGRKNETLTLVFRIASWIKPSAVRCEAGDLYLFRESPHSPFPLIKILSVQVPPENRVVWDLPVSRQRVWSTVVQSHRCSFHALCHVLCSTETFPIYRRGISPRCLCCFVALSCGIFLLGQLQFSSQIFLEWLWRFRNFWSFKRAGIMRVVDFPGRSHE